MWTACPTDHLERQAWMPSALAAMRLRPNTVIEAAQQMPGRIAGTEAARAALWRCFPAEGIVDLTRMTDFPGLGPGEASSGVGRTRRRSGSSALAVSGYRRRLERSARCFRDARRWRQMNNIHGLNNRRPDPSAETGYYLNSPPTGRRRSAHALRTRPFHERPWFCRCHHAAGLVAERSIR